MDNTPNLDAMDDGELVEFASEHIGGKGGSDLFPDQPAIHAILATALLVRYAWATIGARLNRHNGLIRLALRDEARAQAIYDELPEWAKW